MKARTKIDTSIKFRLLKIVLICAGLVGAYFIGHSTKIQQNYPKPRDTSIGTMPLPTDTCDAIEQILIGKLTPEDIRNSDIQTYFNNTEIYNTLFKNGCDNNKDTWRDYAIRNMDIAKGLLPLYGARPDYCYLAQSYYNIGIYDKALSITKMPGFDKNYCPEDIQKLIERMNPTPITHTPETDIITNE
ncbi:MAG: hypothetical protein LBL75_01735 [Rickettsiales bacterium]|jgi:hypothetical protein|nr:hypothetical protein [Rickettsiales bacterium]